MGYYTNYTISLGAGDSNAFAAAKHHIDERIRSISGYDELSIDKMSSEIKWYEHSEHMCQLSREFPDFVFLLDGEGEDGKDGLWQAAYCNGTEMVGTTEIVYKFPFNFTQMLEKHGKPNNHKISLAQFIEASEIVKVGAGLPEAFQSVVNAARATIQTYNKERGIEAKI